MEQFPAGVEASDSAEADGFQWMSEDGFKQMGAQVVSIVVAAEEVDVVRPSSVGWGG